VEPALARTVALQLMAHDALEAHARDEIGISTTLAARPLQAAWASAGAFALGAALPIMTVIAAPPDRLLLSVGGSSLVCLSALGALAARAGGAPPLVGAARVAFWGMLAMAVTAGVGWMFGAAV
jgi:VIT1/CCC1 family predicted Fe2+/Mn2+ transporter